MDLRPETARIELDGRIVEVPAESVQRDAVIIVRPGERLPVDGLILEGSSQMDESMLLVRACRFPKSLGMWLQELRLTVMACCASGLLT